MRDAEPVTICITRTVKSGHEEAFERELHEFVQRSLLLPGQMGVHIMRPAPGSGSREYGIIRKFAHRDALAAFRASSEYRQWSETVRSLTEGRGLSDELTGLESWFTLPGGRIQPLPRWKMATVTLLGVYPTSLLLRETVGRWTYSMPPFLSSLIIAALMVALLTWVIMPALTRLLHTWLHADEKNVTR